MPGPKPPVATQRVTRAIQRFCRLQCGYGPTEIECLDCHLFEFRELNDEERESLFGTNQ